MPNIILSENQQKRLLHTLKKIASAYRILTQEIDDLHDDIFGCDMKGEKEEVTDDE